MASPAYSLADLRPTDLATIEELEHRLGLTLIAWAPRGQERRRPDSVPPEAHLLSDPSEPLL